MYWLISANTRIYDHLGSFSKNGFIDWRQRNGKYKVGDFVFIYISSPVRALKFKCAIEKAGMKSDEIHNDKEFWRNLDEYESSLNGLFMRLRPVDYIDDDSVSLDVLKINGLKNAPQGRKKLAGQLLTFIEGQFLLNQSRIYPEVSQIADTIIEGHKQQILVNKYERSQVARAKCIEVHGYKCKVCDFDFEKTYGEIGTGFIHVHHIKPLGEIGEKYVVDPILDLVPVCPNCHSMLHRGKSGETISIEDLTSMINK